jgi:hypothetical protein
VPRNAFPRTNRKPSKSTSTADLRFIVEELKCPQQ